MLRAQYFPRTIRVAKDDARLVMTTESTANTHTDRYKAHEVFLHVHFYGVCPQEVGFSFRGVRDSVYQRQVSISV